MSYSFFYFFYDKPCIAFVIDLCIAILLTFAQPFIRIIEILKERHAWRNQVWNTEIEPLSINVCDEMSRAVDALVEAAEFYAKALYLPDEGTLCMRAWARELNKTCENLQGYYPVS